VKSNKLVLIRHGESQWNLENRFTGWTDVNLTKKGEREAEIAGQLLRSRLFKFDFVYTSVLKRAIQTMKICLNELKNINIPISYDWRLNERHYGALQGLNKAETSKKYGDEQVLLWRRSYDTPPPKLEIDDKRHPKFDLKYNKLKPFELPSSESLKDTFKRVVSLWENDIFSKIKSGQKILIVAHGNSLRALVKYIDDISDKNIIKLNIPTGIPLVYELDIKLNPVKNYYLNDKNEIEENEIYLPRQDNTN
tara:strand:+ start:873 stop:1625 length:753 start_codon:yes stop_codon:yes gene_type:complete